MKKYLLIWLKIDWAIQLLLLGLALISAAITLLVNNEFLLIFLYAHFWVGFHQYFFSGWVNYLLTDKNHPLSKIRLKYLLLSAIYLVVMFLLFNFNLRMNLGNDTYKYLFYLLLLLIPHLMAYAYFTYSFIFMKRYFEPVNQ